PLTFSRLPLPPQPHDVALRTGRPCILRPSFSFNAPAPTALYTLSLHDALPIFPDAVKLQFVIRHDLPELGDVKGGQPGAAGNQKDRKSTRLNSSHVSISYAVFCLKKKKVRERECCRDRRQTNGPMPKVSGQRAA